MAKGLGSGPKGPAGPTGGTSKETSRPSGGKSAGDKVPVKTQAEPLQALPSTPHTTGNIGPRGFGETGVNPHVVGKPEHTMPALGGHAPRVEHGYPMPPSRPMPGKVYDNGGPGFPATGVAGRSAGGYEEEVE